MGPVTLAAAQWLLTNVGLPILKAGIDQLMVQMGMKVPPVTATSVQALSEAHKTIAEHEYLTSALNTFHVVANYPGQGTTGVYTNAQLRCVAFLGMAAAHAGLKDPQQLIAEKMTEAVYADIDTAKKWLGNNLVNQIISHFPPPGIICPKCGFQNPAGARYCNRDGHSLTPSQSSTPVRLPDETKQPGTIIKAFTSVRYFYDESFWSFGEKGTLIVHDNLLEFLGKRNRVLITNIKDVSYAVRHGSKYAKVIYGDDSPLKFAFFGDESGSFGGTKSIIKVIQKTYL